MILLRLRRRIAKFHVGLDRHEFSSIDRRPSPAWPEIDLLAVDDPVSRILSASEFPKVVQFFADSPSARRSLVSPDTQALLYCLGRNLQGDAIEIGVFKAATTEALARSMNDNIVHAVDPYAYPYVREMLLAWPTEIAKKVVLHPVNSLTFFIDGENSALVPLWFSSMATTITSSLISTYAVLRKYSAPGDLSSLTMWPSPALSWPRKIF